MRCRYTFAVVSDVLLPTSIRFNRELTEFTLKEDKSRFVAIVVEQPGVKMSNLGKIKPPPPGGIGQVVVPAETLLPFVQMELRAIRGSLALWAVHDIAIDNPKVEWIPETPEEKVALSISSFQYSRLQPGADKPRPMPIDMLVRPFLSWRGFLPIEIPLEFFRRGQEDLARSHYIEAIYDFYFVLEFLFADGKFNTNGVRDAFRQSAELQRVIVESQRHPLPDLRDNADDLAKFNTRYRDRTIDEIIVTLTDLRGFLHHQSHKRKTTWNPSSPDEFKVDAFFLCATAHSAVLNLSTSLLFKPGEEAKFHSTSLTSVDGRRVILKPAPEPPGAEKFDVPPPSYPPK